MNTRTAAEEKSGREKRYSPSDEDLFQFQKINGKAVAKGQSMRAVKYQLMSLMTTVVLG